MLTALSADLVDSISAVLARRWIPPTPPSFSSSYSSPLLCLLASFPIIKMQEDVLLFDRLFVGDLIIQSPNPFLGSLSLSR